jgi:hypothetical protein
MRKILLSVAFLACVVAASRGVATLPALMHGSAAGPLHTADTVLFEIFHQD